MRLDKELESKTNELEKSKQESEKLAHDLALVKAEVDKWLALVCVVLLYNDKLYFSATATKDAEEAKAKAAQIE